MVDRSSITSRDVARAAGVSQSAVSRAFAGASGVSEKTRARILAIAEKLGYQPNALASGLITQRSGIVGVVLSQLTNPFLAEATEQLLIALRNRGLRALIFPAKSDEHLIDAATEFGRYRVDGCFVLSPHLSREIATQYDRLGPTVVLFNRLVPGLKAFAVSVDNEAAGAAAARYLISMGHERLGYMHGIEGAASSQDRFNGFAREVGQAGLPPVNETWGGYAYDEAAKAAQAMLGANDRPTAVFAADDIMAMATIDVARHAMGLSVPGGLAVIGFDDANGAERPGYDLTTFRQPIGDMIEAAIDILLDAENGGREPSVVNFDAEFVTRRSA